VGGLGLAAYIWFFDAWPRLPLPDIRWQWPFRCEVSDPTGGPHWGHRHRQPRRAHPRARRPGQDADATRVPQASSSRHVAAVTHTPSSYGRVAFERYSHI